MGKKLFGVIAFVAIAAVAGWNYQQNTNEVELSDLALANVEALAACEQTVGGTCWWNDAGFSKCCEGGWYGCAPCE